MQKVFAMSKVVGLLWTGFMSFPAFAVTENPNPLESFATHVNGESLMYFILLIFIGYLFFRKPLP